MIYYESSLTHSGVKGQRWGNRRYQNKDGTLTSLGYVHYGYLKPDGSLTALGKIKLHRKFATKSEADKEENANEVVEKKQAGVKNGLFKDTVKSGSLLYRYSDTKNETHDTLRKYASITKTDKQIYEQDALQGVLSNKGKSVYLYELQASRKMKVAKGDKVTKDIVKTYGDKGIKKAYRAAMSVKLRENYHKLQKELRDPKNPDHWMYEYTTRNQEKVNKFLHKALYDKQTSAEIYKKYRKKGYDAVVDPEDYLDGYYYPVILLNPGSSTKVKRVKKIR